MVINIYKRDRKYSMIISIVYYRYWKISKEFSIVSGLVG